jgi:selenocysteine lyase/cysteine desulfurase
MRDVADHGIRHIEDWNALLDGARRSVARLIGTRPERIAFLKNTTDGLIATALGVDWRDGDSVVIAEREFPANVYPWLHLERRGVEIRWVPERRSRLRIEDFEAAVDSTTRVLTVSSVEFFTGFRNDLAALGQLCRDRGLLFVVDGIQSVGALRIDVEALGIDCLAADGHKWLMGPEGCALFYVSEGALQRLQIAGLGWASVRTSHDFLDYDPTLQPDARRFETGTQNTPGVVGLKAAVDLLLDIGMESVESRILSLTEKLANGLQERGYRVLSSRQQKESSGIVTFDNERFASLDLAHKLQAERVQLTDRGGCLRLSPHVYNTEAEIDAVLAALP